MPVPHIQNLPHCYQKIVVWTVFHLICVSFLVCTCHSCPWWRTAADCSMRCVGSVSADNLLLEKVAERCVACKLVLPSLENHALPRPLGTVPGLVDCTKGDQVEASGAEVDPLGLEASYEVVVEAFQVHTSQLVALALASLAPPP